MMLHISHEIDMMIPKHAVSVNESEIFLTLIIECDWYENAFSETECASKIVDWFTILLICIQ